MRDEGVEREPLAVVYRPFAQGGDPWFSLLVHADSDPAGLVPSIKEAIREVDSGEHPTFFYQVRSLEELMRDSAWKLNYSTMMLGALAGLSLLLAAVGVYGVLNQAVHQRTREIGLRMAVGAAPSEVLRMVLREGFAVAGTGVVIGVIAAAGLTRFLGSLLYGVEPLDGFTFGLVSVVMLAVAFLASYLPALRATRVDPMVALRHE